MKPSLPTVAILVPILFSLAACGDDQPAQPGAEAGGGDATQQQPDEAGHGTAKDLGALTVAGKQFEVFQFGELVPGQEGAFEVEAAGLDADQLKTLNAYLWIESQDGTQLSASEKGLPSGDRLHFHVMPRKGDKTPYRVVLRLRSGDSDERGSLPLDGHGHEHVEGPHHGVPATFPVGDSQGHLELKLHDDKGDLELWLAEDAAFERPFDLPLDATVEVEFVDVGGRKVTLRPRNTTTNEDEDGVGNVREGKTNYFVFPTRDGEDASWLKGPEFESIVVVRFTRDGQTIRSEEFMLKPHAH